MSPAHAWSMVPDADTSHHVQNDDNCKNFQEAFHNRYPFSRSYAAFNGLVIRHSKKLRSDWTARPTMRISRSFTVRTSVPIPNFYPTLRGEADRTSPDVVRE